MRCDEVMSQEVISIGPNASIHDAAALMLREHISGLPVVNEEHVLLGILTEGDLLRRAELGTDKRRPRWLELLIDPGVLANEYVRSHSRTVADVMTTRLMTVEEGTPLDKAVSLMERLHIKRLPVVRNARVVGIVTRTDLLRALAAAPVPSTKSVADAAIETSVRSELKKLPWAPRDFRVFAHDGVVNLWGTVFEERERHAMRVAAENVPGVKKVSDHLAWVDRSSGVVIETGLGHEVWPIETAARH